MQFYLTFPKIEKYLQLEKYILSSYVRDFK